MTDAYKCPHCGEGPLQLKSYEVDAGVFDDCLYCDTCGRMFEVLPGKEVGK